MEQVWEMVQKFSGVFGATMRRQGFHIDQDDLAGELALAGVKAAQAWDADRQVPLGAFIYMAFANRVKDLKNELARDFGRTYLDLEETEWWLSNSSVAVGASTPRTAPSPELATSRKEALEQCLGRLKGHARLVAQEMVQPSQAVRARAGQLRQGNGQGELLQAIAQVHHLPMETVYNALRRIRDKASLSH